MVRYALIQKSLFVYNDVYGIIELIELDCTIFASFWILGYVTRFQLNFSKTAKTHFKNSLKYHKMAALSAF